MILLVLHIVTLHCYLKLMPSSIKQTSISTVIKKISNNRFESKKLL